jgi:subtilisin family serine protease
MFYKIKCTKTIAACIMLCAASNELFAQKAKENEGYKKTVVATQLNTLIEVAAIKETAESYRLSDELRGMAEQRIKPSHPNAKLPLQQQTNNLYIVDGNNINVTIVATSKADVEGLVKQLEAKGMSDVHAYGFSITGMFPIAQLNEMETMEGIRYVEPTTKGITRSGAVQSQGDKAFRADIARADFGVTGHGVKVGILSDSYNSLGGAQTGVTKGELPGPGNPEGYIKPVVVLRDFFDPSSSDEGRAMAEIVHDVAPGAEIYFHTANNTPTIFAQGIIALANAGCKVIVDDVSYFNQPFFQDGEIAQAVERVKNMGVAYFSAAGNDGVGGYESRFSLLNVPVAGQPDLQFHNFTGNPASAGTNLPIFCPPGALCRVILQWDEPFVSVSGGTGAKTDLDLLVFDNEGNFISQVSETASQIGRDPVSIIAFRNTSTDVFEFRLAIRKKSGPNPRLVKLIIINGARLFLNYTNVPGVYASTVYGHPNSNAAIALGAAPYNKTIEFGASVDEVQDFSSRGGTNILFTKQGRRTFDFRLKPEVTGPDEANTSFFINGFDPDEDGIPNFPGTSASAPHAAAVAALCIEAASCVGPINPTFLKYVFLANTNDMDDPRTPNFDYGFDVKTGFGFMRADDIVSSFAYCNYDLKKNETASKLPPVKETENAFYKVFPNPATNDVTITLMGKTENIQGAAISVLDVTGKQIPVGYTQKDNQFVLKVQALNPGNYFVKIVKGNFSKLVRFVKQ